MAKSRQVPQGQALFFCTGPTFNWKPQRERCWSRGGLRLRRLPTKGNCKFFRSCGIETYSHIETWCGCITVKYDLCILSYLFILFSWCFWIHKDVVLVALEAPCATQFCPLKVAKLSPGPWCGEKSGWCESQIVPWFTWYMILEWLEATSNCFDTFW